MDVAWPDGEPVVALQIGRVFLQERRDGATPDAPAGLLTVMACLRCADGLWNRLREGLEPIPGNVP